jgi:hypothetical protein
LQHSSSALPWALGETPARYRHCPATRTGPFGGTVVATARGLGLPLDPWQADVLLDALNVDPISGLWSTPRVAVAVPRQNGKGAIIEAVEVAFLLGVFPEARLLIHSAHEFKTAQNGFQRLLSYFETVPALAAARESGQVKIGTAAAREFVTVTFEGVSRTVKFLARSKGSGRGFSADLLILDEAQELSEEVFAAILPTVSARPNAQIWLFGTPPSENMNGEVFTRFRGNALAGDDPRLAYFEWSAPEDADPSHPLTWACANPAYGLRIREESIRDEYLAMDEDTFGRERLGQWDGAGSLGVIPLDSWEVLASDADPEGRVVFAVDVSPDRQRASIGVAGYVHGDLVMVQAIENRKGTGWVVPRLKELTSRWQYAAVVLDSGGPAASLLPDLKRAKIRRVRTLVTREVVQACGAFYDAAMGTPGGTDSDGNPVEPRPAHLRHPDQPLLNDALAAARKRPLGDAWAWHRKSATADITPLVAVTFAAFGLASAKNRSTSSGSGRAVVL